MKELVVREAVGAAIPLAGVGCAIERVALSRLAARFDGRPFAGASMTEDYEMGLRLGAIGIKTMFVRLPLEPGSRAVVASRGHFPANHFGLCSAEGTLDRRNRVCGLGSTGLEGWAWRALDADARPAGAIGSADHPCRLSRRATLGSGGAGCGARSARCRTRFPGTCHNDECQPLAAGMAAGDAGKLHQCRLWLARGAAVTAANRGRKSDCRPFRSPGALKVHSSGGAKRWDKTHHIFPMELPRA